MSDKWTDAIIKKFPEHEADIGYLLKVGDSSIIERLYSIHKKLKGGEMNLEKAKEKMVNIIKLKPKITEYKLLEYLIGSERLSNIDYLINTSKTTSQFDKQNLVKTKNELTKGALKTFKELIKEEKWKKASHKEFIEHISNKHKKELDKFINLAVKLSNERESRVRVGVHRRIKG